MSGHPAWMYDEAVATGVDYADVKTAEAYDAEMGAWRDVRGENEETLRMLAPPADGVMMELGAGTCELSLMAARRCRHAHAVDVSAAMLAVGRRKAEKAGVENITFHAAGFLSFDLPPGSVDAAASHIALHHLPDFWKFAGLRRVARALRPGGLFLLKDVVFSLDGAEPEAWAEKAVEAFGRAANPEFGRRFANHIKREYSTLDWIMQGLLERAGFRIVEQDRPSPILRRYVCERV